MDVQTAAKTIQLILAPVVMVSACGILLTGMLGHFGNINDRIRMPARKSDVGLHRFGIEGQTCFKFIPTVAF